MKRLLIALICLLPGCRNAAAQSFGEVLRQPWQEVFADDFRAADTTRWQLDGLQGRILHTPQGMELHAGDRLWSDSAHVVLWTRRMFRGDIRVEYDFTRLDTSRAESVNILYLHATGCGEEGYDKDIMRWNDRRTVPAMRTYFDRMNLYHISYAVALGDTLKYDYIRARRYRPDAKQGLQGTALMPEYENTGLFLPGVTYHMTVVKSGARLYMQVTGGGQQRLFRFDLDTQPALEEGYLGFRQMWGRSSRYANLKIYELNTQKQSTHE